MLVALILSVVLCIGLTTATVLFGYFNQEANRENNRLLLEIVREYGQVVKEYTNPPVYEEVDKQPMNMAAVGMTEYSGNGAIARPEQVGDEDPLAQLEEMWDAGLIGTTPNGLKILEEIDEIEGAEGWRAGADG